MRGMIFKGTMIAASLAGLIPAGAAAQISAPIVAAPLSGSPVTAAVNRYYDSRPAANIWFRAGQLTPGAAQLVGMLRRAPLEGLDSGPQLAAQVEAAMASAAGGAPAAINAADRILSIAWVTYVQHLQSPTKGMIYGDPGIRSKPAHPDMILHQAAGSPSLGDHLTKVAAVNPIYSQLREAAVREAALPGGGISAKLVANLDRARAVPATGRFLIVDVPSAKLWMYENGQPVDSMKIVVGMPEYPTPMIASVIHYTTFNPYWHVPDHLVRKTVAKGVINGGAAYLKARGYEVVSKWGNDAAIIPASEIDWKAVAAGTAEVKVRQLPGGANSMGKMKFPFANGEGIFLHDTPTREHFAKSDRAISNGCVRVEDAARLARWMFGHEPAALTSKAPEQHVQIGRGIPVYVTYLTAQPGDGQLAFFDDPYGKDAAFASRSAAASIR